MSVLVLAMALFIHESYRTEVIFLGELPAERAIALHERLIGQAGESAIVLGKQPNVIVVKDTPRRLGRFHELLAVLDRKGAAERHVYVRPVRHLAPSELAQRVTELTPARDDLTMVPDDRSRQLLVMCRPALYATLDRLMRRLDVATDHGRDIRVTPAPADSKPGEFPP